MATKTPPHEAYINTTRLDLKYKTLELMDELDELRKKQLVRSEDPVQNLSVMATALVIVVSLTVVIMGMMLPCCVKARRDRDRKRRVLSASAARKDLARRADDRFQLLRMALEATAIRGWEEASWGVPGVGSEARIGGLKVAEPVMDNLLVRYPNDSKWSSVISFV